MSSYIEQLTVGVYLVTENSKLKKTSKLKKGTLTSIVLFMNNIVNLCMWGPCCGSGPFFSGSGSGSADPVLKIRIWILLST